MYYFISLLLLFNATVAEYSVVLRIKKTTDTNESKMTIFSLHIKVEFAS